jgi:hypothetical protein
MYGANRTNRTNGTNGTIKANEEGETTIKTMGDDEERRRETAEGEEDTCMGRMRNRG